MRIGSYQVLLELARGGMGKVYLARSVGPRGVERLVAIKRAHEHLLVTSQAVAERFLDEARIAAQVHHSNVIGVHQAGSDDDGYYLVLDYVEGVSLDGLIDVARLSGARVPPQIVLTIVCDALAGLHAAHETTDAHGRSLGILHRDVSTQNLLVGRDGVTRLSDFGIAKSALSLVVTDEIYVQGKLAYMSPEYLQRKPVDRTIDVYAMGVTLYIALTGDVPWPDADDAQLLPAILVQGVPPLASRAKELGPEIAQVVDRACHRDARERFPTARAMLDALESASKAIGGLARHVEVAEFVESLAGEELRARRELVNQRREELERGPEEPAVVPLAAPPREPSERHDRVEGWAPGEPRVSTDALRRRWEERRPWKAVAYAALAAALVAIGLAAFRRASPSSAAPAVPASAPEPPRVAAPVTSSEAPSNDVPTVVPATVSATAAPSAPPPRSNERRPPATRRKGAPDTPGVVPFSTANPYR